jgi:hypothetical protein
MGALTSLASRRLLGQDILCLAERILLQPGTSKKGLYKLKYTREDYEKMVDWMIRRPRLGYGSPRSKTGSGWHKMALSFPGRTANALYDKYTRFLVKIWPLRDIKHEALRRKLESSKPVIE